MREIFFGSIGMQSDYLPLTIGMQSDYQKGDFRVDQQCMFEVGGKNKDFSQIKDLPDAYLAVDGIERGLNRKIPLWTFGMMY